MVHIRILEAQKHTDPDPDPQQWLNLVFILVLGSNSCSVKYRWTFEIREYRTVPIFGKKLHEDPGKGSLK
jgi:hypothetical protein